MSNGEIILDADSQFCGGRGGKAGRGTSGRDGRRECGAVRVGREKGAKEETKGGAMMARRRGVLKSDLSAPRSRGVLKSELSAPRSRRVLKSELSAPRPSFFFLFWAMGRLLIFIWKGFVQIIDEIALN